MESPSGRPMLPLGSDRNAVKYFLGLQAVCNSMLIFLNLKRTFDSVDSICTAESRTNRIDRNKLVVKLETTVIQSIKCFCRYLHGR